VGNIRIDQLGLFQFAGALHEVDASTTRSARVVYRPPCRQSAAPDTNMVVRDGCVADQRNPDGPGDDIKFDADLGKGDTKT